ncbi:MAG: D-tyrosyl-tRNA(Tyr) deacylase, partial [Roseiflexus castenholzii]
MRAVIQRVSEASVRVDGRVIGAIGRGLLILIGVGVGDTEAEAKLLAEKSANLRIFADDEGRFNRSLLDIGGE